MNLVDYRLGWTRRSRDGLITLWLTHDRCGDGQVGGWEDAPTLAELNTFAAAHDVACRQPPRGGSSP